MHHHAAGELKGGRWCNSTAVPLLCRFSNHGLAFGANGLQAQTQAREVKGLPSVLSN